MKKIIFGILVMMSVQAHAGVLINRSTNESIKFDVVTQVGQNSKLVIDGTNAGFPVREIDIASSGAIKEWLNDSSNLFAGAYENVYALIYCNYQLEVCSINPDPGAKVASILIPVYNIPALLALAADGIAFPVTAIKKLILTINANQDLKVFSKVMVKDQTITVSNKRFNRVKAAIQSGISSLNW